MRLTFSLFVLAGLPLVLTAPAIGAAPEGNLAFTTPSNLTPSISFETGTSARLDTLVLFTAGAVKCPKSTSVSFGGDGTIELSKGDTFKVSGNLVINGKVVGEETITGKFVSPKKLTGKIASKFVGKPGGCTSGTASYTATGKPAAG